MNGNNSKYRRFNPGITINLYQEDWWPFQNLPNALKKFTKLTNIEVNLSWDRLLSSEITDKMWNEMENSFIKDEPPYDLVCADPLIINQYAVKGRVQELDNYIERDSYSLDDFEKNAIEICKINGEMFGLPCCNVCNILMYREDLFEKYKIKAPNTMKELLESSMAIQEAVRNDGKKDFYGITARGAKGAGYIGWIVASTWAPSWNVQFYNNNELNIVTEEHISALEHFVELLKKAGPPEQAEMEWIDSLRYYEEGKSAMIIEVGMEFAHLYKKGGTIMENSRCKLIPAGPTGVPHPGLYSPSFAIPKKSKVKEASWELMKFLCSPEQQLEDALLSDAIETSRKTVLNNPEMDRYFNKDLLGVTRINRKYAKDERPYSRHGLKVSAILGDEYNLVLKGEKTAKQALEDAAKKIESLGKRW